MRSVGRPPVGLVGFSKDHEMVILFGTDQTIQIYGSNWVICP